MPPPPSHTFIIPTYTPTTYTPTTYYTVYYNESEVTFKSIYFLIIIHHFHDYFSHETWPSCAPRPTCPAPGTTDSTSG